ncbi:MAG: hypothetical protein H0W40_11365 [Methylibium sp.]|uniref:hypothetical protein n=1 Tax=Methylibium sp. TaxID=2067992 RepID=UPI0017F213D6|nr:hypothetical protein [Methylibium sp.]MBA3597956.1 hypothetical protein [Methylibium sp.]
MTQDRTDIGGRIAWHKERIAEAEARHCREVLAAHRDPIDLTSSARLRAIADELAGHHSAIANLTPFASERHPA